VKLPGSDLKRLALPIGACLGLVLAGAACYFAADSYRTETQEMRAATAAQRSEVQSKLSRATEEEREIRENLQQYKALVARGIIGEEKRLDWVDDIAAIKTARHLFNIHYDIDAQRALDYPGFAAGSGVNFMVSRMKIEMQLLHEEDLLNFIDDLAKRGKSYVSVRSCNVLRVDRAAAGTSLSPRLRAECILDLITIRNKPA
jgi:hypothetical protein